MALILDFDSFTACYHNMNVSRFSRSGLICSYTFYISLPSEKRDLKDIACIICLSRPWDIHGFLS